MYTGKHLSRRHIFLTGFMGSGKSTIGPPVARALGYAFIDLDNEIETGEGKTIEEIFVASGEPLFRSLERKYLQQLIGEADSVFALGGGTVTVPGMISYLKSTGVLVYLRTDADELVPRLRGHTHRPLLHTSDGKAPGDAELYRRISSLLDQREAYYREADIVIETSGVPVPTVIENVLKSIAEFVKKEELN
jgi:shikimate kinase